MPVIEYILIITHRNFLSKYQIIVLSNISFSLLIAFFSILETYEREILSFSAVSFCVWGDEP